MKQIKLTKWQSGEIHMLPDNTRHTLLIFCEGVSPQSFAEKKLSMHIDRDTATKLQQQLTLILNGWKK